jgi:hypothetical protein
MVMLSDFKTVAPLAFLSSAQPTRPVRRISANLSLQVFPGPIAFLPQ